MAIGEELLRRDALLDRALEAKAQLSGSGHSKGRNNAGSGGWTSKKAAANKEIPLVIDSKVQTLSTDELFDYLQQEVQLFDQGHAVSSSTTNLAHTSAPFNPNGAGGHIGGNLGQPGNLMTPH